MSDFNPRRPLDDDKPTGYLESDKDFVENNFELAVRLLETYGETIRLAKAQAIADGMAPPRKQIEWQSLPVCQ